LDALLLIPLPLVDKTVIRVRPSRKASYDGHARQYPGHDGSFPSSFPIFHCLILRLAYQRIHPSIVLDGFYCSKGGASVTEFDHQPERKLTGILRSLWWGKCEEAKNPPLPCFSNFSSYF
jgi:hypothetical protein